MTIALDFVQPPAEYALCKNVQFEFDSLVGLINTEISGLTSIYAPVGATYVTLTTNSSLTNERILTGTTNQISLTDNGAGSTIVLSTPQNIHTGATPTFASETLTATTNQLILGTTRTVTFTAPTPASSSRTITFPDLAANYSVVGTESAQTINGAKTFTGTFDAQGNINLTGNIITNVNVIRSTSGSSVLVDVENTSNTASSDATLKLGIAGTSGGDPSVLFVISSGTTWSLGTDNSDTDKFKLSQNATLGTNDFFIVTAAGEITQPLQPSFLVVDGTGATDVTGDGTTYTEAWPTEIFDQGSDFASNTFTAPVTGRYHLSATVLLDNILVAHTIRRMFLVTSNRSYNFIWIEALAETNNSIHVSVIADMDANDTAIVQVQVSGSTKTVDIEADGAYNYFSGSLIN